MTTPLPPTADSASRARVLVIDDDASVRSLLVAVLKRNYRVIVANDGLSGFTKAKEIVPDVAVIDIQMPGWDGLQTLKAFRQEPSLARVRTIVLTSDASRETVLAAIQAGANDYMIKTAFSREEFDRKISRLLQSDSLSSIAILGNLSLQDRGSPSPTMPEGISEVPRPHQPLRTSEHAGEKNSITSSASEPSAISSDLQEVLDSWE